MVQPAGHAYDVRVWKTRSYKGKKRTTHSVRWRVHGVEHHKTFATAKLAESCRSALVVALNRGEPFDPSSGLPPSMRPIKPGVTWLDHARDFVDHKWARSSARHRKGLAEALTAVTMALWDSEPRESKLQELRDYLRNQAFNTPARSTPLSEDRDNSDEVLNAARWASSHSLALDELMNPVVCRRAVEACGVRLDGSPAAQSTTARKRSALYSCLDFAVELGRLPSNPMILIKVKRTVNQEVVDRRVVVNPEQARALLSAVREIYPSLEAFFGCLYYAGLRPSEARHLRDTDLALPASGWGTSPCVGPPKPVVRLGQIQGRPTKTALSSTGSRPRCGWYRLIPSWWPSFAPT